ncbi:MAG TPA: membrane protein insertase YidC [Paludibacteraceae bacterium]|nr:membrane protein insertase YidC [Paludibacteraceae bacterium]
MDKNSIFGIVLILAIILGFNWFTQPTAEEKAAKEHYRDSIAMVEESNRLAEKALEVQTAQEPVVAETPEYSPTALYGDFANSAEGTEEFVTLENDLLKLVFTNKGGRIYSAQLKNYQTHDSLPLILFEGKESELDFTLLTRNNRVLNTKELFFVPQKQVADTSAQTMVMRLSINSDSYIDFTYTLPKDDYMVHFDIQAHNMMNYLDPTMNALQMKWSQRVRQQEKGRKFESRYATLNFRYAADDMEKLSESKDDAQKPTGKVRWIAFKDQFFSTVFIAENSFTSTALESVVESETSGYLKNYKAETAVTFDPRGAESSKFRIFLGPNHYKTLSHYDKDVASDQKLRLQELIPLGWSLFRWVSSLLIIPMFNFFGSFIGNYGLIILLMTFVIKLILLPFTYKSYMSTAKMRVLKPQIDEINAKIPADKAMERQQATMALYKRVGVSPMSGCLPMLLQMPILFAMFAFFPSAIELRQESFLWAADLSSYDAIFSWDVYIPLISPYFGNHISLFCLLMTITNVIYTKLNMANQMGGQQMAAMKWMMYLMPFMFMFMFNDYASGLSYYYFISLLITIGQTYLFRLFVNEEKVLKKLEAKKQKPAKKSGFMARLEEAQRQQQKAARSPKKR